MAQTPAEEAKYALDSGSDRSSLSPEAQVIYDRLAVERQARQIRSILEARIAALEGRGVSNPATEAEIAILRADRDKVSAAEDQITAGGRPVLPTLSLTAVRCLERPPGEQLTIEELKKLAARTTGFLYLGVAVRDGNVYGSGKVYGKGEPLGPLAGAHAEVISGKTPDPRSGGRRVYDAAGSAVAFGPVGLLAGLPNRGKGVAVVTLADGIVQEKEVTDKISLTKAQAEAVKFNAMAAAATPVASSPAGSGIAAELERLTTLHEYGALDDEEFRAAKARIIHGG